MASTKTKIYIAGKIEGDPNYKDKFAKAQKQLEKDGFSVLNPATLPEGMTSAEYMRICFAMIDTADAVAFIDDFMNSQGAMLELDYCKYIKKHAFMVHLRKDN